MGPTEVEKTPYVIPEETMVYKNDEEILDFNMCCGPEQETGFSEISGECIADLDSDEELMNLFILAVIFTRGNPFDSRKHWRMRYDFLETNLKIRCLENIREVDESAENVPTSPLFPKKTPVVRLIHVQPRELDCETEDNDDGKTGFVANEVCTDECGCNIKDYSCADDSGNTSLIKLDGKKAINVTFQNTQTDIINHRGHERFVDEDGFENVDSVSEKTKIPLFGCGHPESWPRTTFEKDHWLLPEPVQKEFLDKNTALGHAAETKSRPGFFTKRIRRFLNFFRKNKVGVLPPSVDGPATHAIST